VSRRQSSLTKYRDYQQPSHDSDPKRKLNAARPLSWCVVFASRRKLRKRVSKQQTANSKQPEERDQNAWHLMKYFA
jgi:hypothetical protein